MRSNTSKTQQQVDKIDNESKSDVNTTVDLIQVQEDSKTDNDESSLEPVHSSSGRVSEPSVVQIIGNEKPLVSTKPLQKHEDSTNTAGESSVQSSESNVNNDDDTSNIVPTTEIINDDYDDDEGVRCTISLGSGNKGGKSESKEDVVDSTTSSANASYQHDDAFSISDQGTPGIDGPLEEFDLSRGFNKRRVEKAVNG